MLRRHFWLGFHRRSEPLFAPQYFARTTADDGRLKSFTTLELAEDSSAVGGGSTIDAGGASDAAIAVAEPRLRFAFGRLLPMALAADCVDSGGKYFSRMSSTLHIQAIRGGVMARQNVAKCFTRP